MRELHLPIDQSAGRRAGLERALRDAIQAGRLHPGSPLPSTRALARDLGFSRATVVAAFEQLAAEGYVSARHGSGTEVARATGPATEPPAAPAVPPPIAHNFLPGEPDPSGFPRQAWMRSLRATLHQAPDDMLGYGDMAGQPELRRALATYLGRARAVSVSAEAVSVFPGFMATLSILCETFRRLGIERIAIENPSLFVCRDIMKLAGVTIVPVGVDREGILVEDLDHANVGAAIVTPAHQYPTGAVLSADRRTALIEWSRQNDAWIIEDDYDGEFRYDRQPVGALQGLAPDRVIYAGTASKSLATGLRLAWAVAPPELRGALARTKHARSGVSNIDQLALAHFIDRGELDKHIRSSRIEYRERQLALTEALAASASWIAVPEVQAGLHLTCALDDHIEERHVIAKALSHGIGLIGLEPHWFGPATTSGLVIGYSRVPKHQFSASLNALSRFVAGYQPSRDSNR